MLSSLRTFRGALFAALFAGAAHGAPPTLTVSAAQVQAMGLELAPAVTAEWVGVARLPARAELDTSVRQLVTARHPGTVVGVYVREGDSVTGGQALLALQSADWADAIATAQGNAARMTQAAQAEARARALLEAGVVARRELESAQAELATARAAAASDAARAAGARIGRDGTVELAAQVAGRVLRRPVDPGQAVDAGEILLELASGDALVARASAPGRLLGQIAPGMRALTAAGAEGKVTAVGSALDPATQGLPVRFSLPAGAAVPGQTIELAVSHPAPAGTVELPASAVVDLAGRATVFVARSEGFAVQAVELLARDGGLAWVSGVAAGAQVVTRGVLALKSLAESDAATGVE